MPHPLSAHGLAHTALSLVPVLAGLYGFVRFHRIVPSRRSRQVYLLGVLALAAAFFAAWLVPRFAVLGRARPTLQALALNSSFFLLRVPAIAEILTGLPTHHPLAAGLQDPVVRAALSAWLLVVLFGCGWQAWSLRRDNRPGPKA